MTAEQARLEFDADLVWLPFDLHPEYPPNGVPRAELHRRYGIDISTHDPMRDRFAAAGVDYNPPDVVSNTRSALRLGELAREHGLHDQFHVRLMHAYWSEATDIGDIGELRRLAAEVGVDPGDVDRVLADPAAFLDLVEASTRQAQSIGVNGIPAFLLDRRLIVLGAHPLETFRLAFEQLTH